MVIGVVTSAMSVDSVKLWSINTNQNALWAPDSAWQNCKSRPEAEWQNIASGQGFRAYYLLVYPNAITPNQQDPDKTHASSDYLQLADPIISSQDAGYASKDVCVGLIGGTFLDLSGRQKYDNLNCVNHN